MSQRFKKVTKKTEFLRPPIVTIMGHVDHGKTTLLDYIRKTNITTKEIGGITQHIGAYRVMVPEKQDNGKKQKDQERWITFIDTPGHEAFAKMRARGAEVTDIVVLVVAANDGVMPQTIESINHIKAAKVPFIVAINKIDLPEADIERVKRQLAKNNVLVEGYGGEVVCLPISAKTGKGVKDLLEMILLIRELNAQKFLAEREGDLEAYVIEAKLDKQVGPVATVIVKNGTLRVGERIAIEGIEGRIRAIRDEWGKSIKEIEPGTAGEILGLRSVPTVGKRVLRIKDKDAKKYETFGVYSSKKGVETKEKIKEDTPKKIKIILKADTFGSLEALIYSLPENIEIFEKGIGEISESDVLLAKTVGAIILGFNVGILKEAKKLAETEGVLFKTYNIIYELLEEIREVVVELQKPKPKEKILGKAKIIAEFQGSSGRIAGCKVSEGRISKSDNLRIERDQKTVFDNLKVSSMRHLKKDVDKVSMGMECGIVLIPEVDFRVGDMIVSYRKLENL